ncbi:hypothetical protein KUTeg_013683 [Tegillarca granosa]|uniref:Steroid 5-alpha reductase C-terminal domain-containing protein n=1 Tax=Tegillarca granosa TaxID=220873 RepID=A0ABQ9EUE8_TEGGR|nr:hypothetical protein KUTeg_013683 [Tegillarca granosa]
MGNILVKSAAVDFGIQLAGWGVASLLKTEKFYDLAALQSLRWGGRFHKRQKVQTAMVATWATRLGLYLFTRILKEGQDKRFNRGQFIRHGLWGIVRYPNYLGEIMMWTGLYISAFSTFKGWEHVGVISPIFTTFILTQLSGIPIQEKMAMKRWGSDPAYQEHIRNTPKLIPFVW